MQTPRPHLGSVRRWAGRPGWGADLDLSLSLGPGHPDLDPDLGPGQSPGLDQDLGRGAGRRSDPTWAQVQDWASSPVSVAKGFSAASLAPPDWLCLRFGRCGRQVFEVVFGIVRVLAKSTFWVMRGAFRRRAGHRPSTDQPCVMYNARGFSARRWASRECRSALRYG